jgi:hypothetical protein
MFIASNKRFDWTHSSMLSYSDCWLPFWSTTS